MTDLSETTVVSVRNVHKSYGSNPLFSGINFDIVRGRSYGLVGVNGSGKSVLMKMMCGFERPDSGDVIINPEFLSRGRTFPERFGVAINGPAYLPALTAEANLLRLARIRKVVGIDRVREVIRDVGLAPSAKRVGSYSMGMKQKLSLAQALLEHPTVLILDEPFNSLDAESVSRIKTLLRHQSEDGTTLVFSSHSAVDVNDLCDEILTITAGLIEKSTPPS